MNKDDADRAQIVAVMKYRRGFDVYMGSIATAGLYHTLGLPYGDAGFADALAGATRAQLDKLLALCSPYTDDMKQHPVTTCPCCGQSVYK